MSDNPNTATLIAKVPSDMHLWLKKQSYETDQSIAQLVRQAVAEYISRQKQSK